MNPTICPRCGSQAASGNHFCGYCGAELDAAARAFCTSCGQELTPDARFCGNCGAQPGQAPSGVVTARPAAPLPKPKGHRGLALGLATLTGLCLLISVVVVVGFALRDRTFSRGGIIAGDVSTPVSDITPQAQQTPGPGEADVSAAGVTLRRPAGWVSREDSGKGLVLASRGEDLGGEQPAGPRLKVELVATSAKFDPDALLKKAGGSDSQLSLIQAPDKLRAGGVEGVTIALLEKQGGRSFGREYVYFNLGKGQVYRFTLEAPDKAFTDNRATLEGIVKGAKFASAR